MAHRPILVHYLPVCIQAKNGFYTFKWLKNQKKPIS